MQVDLDRKSVCSRCSLDSAFMAGNVTWKLRYTLFPTTPRIIGSRHYIFVLTTDVNREKSFFKSATCSLLQFRSWTIDFMVGHNAHDKSSPGLSVLTFPVDACRFNSLAFLVVSMLIQVVFPSYFCPLTSLIGYFN